MCFSTFQAPLLRRAAITVASPTTFLFHHRRRRRRFMSVLPFSSSFLNPISPDLRLSASLSEFNLNLSTTATADDDDDGYNGWGGFESTSPTQEPKGLPKILIMGVGTFVASVLIASAYFTLCKRGVFMFKLPDPLVTLHGIVVPIDSKDDKAQSEDSNIGTFGQKAMESQTKMENLPHVTVGSVSSEKLERVKVSVPVDSTQQEALSVLKKLKIIDDQVKADVLCTRREYARWLVRLNSLLERSPKHRILPSASLSVPVFTAFDDISVEDPDFEYIQALAEAGIIPSKLSLANSFSVGSRGDKSFYFYPDRFISRQNLIDWKAQIEYVFLPEAAEQMSRRKVVFLDAKEINSDSSPELFIDALAGDKSIVRKVFGQSRRFQPKQPSTKAQAAVALTSGRMAEAISNELLRLEFESSAREAAMKEIRSELLDKGDIKRFWDKMITEEKLRGLEVEKLYTSALQDLEHQKTVQINHLADYSKEKAAIDCQRKLLVSLKEEVDETSNRLLAEKELYVKDKRNLQGLLNKVESKQEVILDKKSMLQAEIEALQILKSWVEDEARKSQARAKVLEEVGRRWKWQNQS